MPLDKLLDEYEQYIKLRSTDLFEDRIALIRQEIKERCERAAAPVEAEPEPATETDPHGEATFGMESAVDAE